MTPESFLISIVYKQKQHGISTPLYKSFRDEILVLNAVLLSQREVAYRHPRPKEKRKRGSCPNSYNLIDIVLIISSCPWVNVVLASFRLCSQSVSDRCGVEFQGR